MEFGSSHVYAGTEEVYYSSVPVSDDSIDKHKATNNTDQGQENLETVYEDFDNAETKINSNTNAVYNEVGEDESKSSGIYDEVAPDSAIKSKIKIKKKKKKKNPQKIADSISSDFEADFTKAPPPKLENQYTVQPGLTASNTNPFYQALIDANAIQAALPTGVNLIDFVFDETNEYESTPDPADPAVPSPQLYPSLDKLVDPSTLSISPPITPTAPSLSAVNSLKRLEPSAPQFTQSMRIKDRNAVVNQNRAAEVAADPSYSSVNTNIVSVKLGIVGQHHGTYYQHFPPTKCSVCGAVTTLMTKTKWNCRFCESENSASEERDVPPIPPTSQHDVSYLLQPSVVRHNDNDSLIVFCIDVSGSMCVSSEVAGGGSAFVSRLQGVQQAICDQLIRIEASKPNARVALVTFCNVVQALGDGSPNNVKNFSDFELFDFDYLFNFGRTATLPSPITGTRIQLSRAINNLKASGGTALGPALLYSTALASQRPGSQVIVCTDGRANVGLGSLETEDAYQMCHYFYGQTTDAAIKHGVIVSMMSIGGTDCRLVEVGKVANSTAGKVSIVDLENISQSFHDILSESVLATQVSVELSTHKHLFLQNRKEVTGCNIDQFVGNITNQSEITFRYGINKQELQGIPPPQRAPFQLRIKYRSSSGSICMRVLTQDRPVTESRMIAEMDMNPAVIGTFATQYAAQLALDGEVDEAKELTQAHKDLIGRGMNLKSQAAGAKAQSEQIYESVQKRMDNITEELAKVDTSSSYGSIEEEESYEDVNVDQSLGDDEVYERLPHQAVGPQSTNLPPALPPRGYQAGKSKSTSSITSMLTKKIPKAIKIKKKKKATPENYKDEVAQKMFSFSKLSSKSFMPTLAS